ncbi:phosphatase [Acetobacter malorum]|uniref:Phosphatase n=1 Tax=Acetobacter malorum TaxID=178901 RepID=A0A149UP09_9PROT|nr:HAD-IIIC family phosphatase [Acetobacter malorum]KXV69730.1 phosphatase [Acetobacter malorum]
MIKTKNFQGQPNSISPSLTNGTWSFGPEDGSSFTESLILSPSGKIEGYSHPNERSWRIEKYRLLILKEDGNVMWYSVETFKDERGLLTFLLGHPNHPETRFILKQNEAQSNAAQPDAQTALTPVEQSPSSLPEGISDAEFLFPSDLEITSVKIKKILLVGSSLAALYHEQLQERHPEIKFDYIPYDFINPLPESLPSAVSDYNFQYLQLPLRSVLSDRIIWGFRFNETDFTDSILQDAYNAIDALLAATMLYNEQHGLLTFVSNFLVPQMNTASSMHDCGGNNDLTIIIQKLNSYLSRKISSYKNAYILNTDGVASSLGKRYILDDIVYFYSHGSALYQDWDDFGLIPRNQSISPVESIYPIKKEAFLDTIFRQMLTAYRTTQKIDHVKAVIFDLDNTLWRGKVVEQYQPEAQPWPRRDGWPLGIWEAIHYLRARGILVALCSNNDYDNVKARWSDIVAPHFISLDDFSVVKINRAPKEQNIAEICSELNLAEKEVIFVGDNSEKRDTLTSTLPDIRIIGGNPYLTRRILLWSAETQIPYKVDQPDKQKEIIRPHAHSEKNPTIVESSPFLASLSCEVSFTLILSANQPECHHVLELTNNTHQFNTNGQNWSFDSLSNFLNDGGKILAFSTKDKFADYGLVGALYLKGSAIIQCIMRNSVLGMNVEEFSVAEAVKLIRHNHPDNTNIHATIKETPDNTACRGIYLRTGFHEIEPQEGVRQFILESTTTPKLPSHVRTA